MNDMDYDEIDWRDESGLIAFRELEKRYAIRETTKESVRKVTELTPDDWILILLYSNGGSLRKVLILDLMIVFSERSGLSDTDIFSYHDKRASSVTESALKYLELNGKLGLEMGVDQDGHIFKNYIIKETAGTKYLWDLLPAQIKGVLYELKNEFGNKKVQEVVEYVKDAYPEYTVYDEK